MKYVNQALKKIQGEIDGNVVVMANLFLVLTIEQTKSRTMKSSFQQSAY